MDLRQYQLVRVKLAGDDIRPCVIVSPDEMNQFLRGIIVAPVTTRSTPFPTRVKITYNTLKGWVVLDQIETVPRKQIIKILDTLDSEEIKQIKSVLKEIFVD